MSAAYVKYAAYREAIKTDTNKQLTTTRQGDPNLKDGMIRRVVGKEEYIRILEKGENGYVMSDNPDGTYWTASNVTSPGEAHVALNLTGPQRFGFVDVPYENFDYAVKYTDVRVQNIQGGFGKEIITEYGVGISVRGGRLIRFDTVAETRFGP